MHCDHCCMSATKQGDDMSIETFMAALENADECITIGGGEPTLHPKFWQFIGLALGSPNVSYIDIITNGSVKHTALALAGMTKKDVLGCRLSTDYFHDYDMVDDSVRDAFASLPNGTHDITRGGQQEPILTGRWKENSDTGREGCTCSDFIVRPNGDVFACDCDGSPKFGNVFDGLNIPDDWEYGECYKNQHVSV